MRLIDFRTRWVFPVCNGNAGEGGTRPNHGLLSQDAIHRELQELLWGQLSTARQSAMLRSVATRHARLLRGKVGAALDRVSAA